MFALVIDQFIIYFDRLLGLKQDVMGFENIQQNPLYECAITIILFSLKRQNKYSVVFVLSDLYMKFR